MRRLLLTTAVILAAGPSAAGATTFTVNATGDATDAAPGNNVCATAGGQCTLRAAIVESNAHAGVDAVTVPAGTYNVATTLPVTSNLTVSGAGAGATIVDGASGQQVFGLSGGAGAVTITGLTVTGAWTGVTTSVGELTLDRVAISGNVQTIAGTAYGAGMYISGSAKVFIARSAIVNNAATSTLSDAMGGGIYMTAGQLEIDTSTIAGNSAAAPSVGESSFGGGISAIGGTVTLRHVTMSGNSATAGSAAHYGGNIYLQSTTASAADSIFSDGVASPGYQNCGGPSSLATTGRNIDSGTSCGFGAGQLPSTNPQLVALGDHGGPTVSAPPQLGSPAIGQAGACPVGGTDQRGAAAPAGAGCDIGAGELSADLGVSLALSRTEVPAGGDVTVIATVTNGGFDPAVAAALDLTPAGAQVVLATPSAGTCTLAVRCELGTIPAGGSVTVSVVVRAPDTGAIAISAATSGTIPESSGGNDTAAATVAVTGSSGGGGGGGTADTTKPVLGPLKLSGRARTGKAIALTSSLSEQASLAITVQRLVPGRKAGTRCSVKARKGKRCTLQRTSGALTASRAGGAIKLTIPAKLARKKLAPGRYKVTVVATDVAGNRSAARTLTVTVRR